MARPINNSAHRTRKQIEEAAELFRWQIENAKCSCMECALARSLYNSAYDALLWAAGENPSDFCKIMRGVKKRHAHQTKHQCAIAE